MLWLSRKDIEHISRRLLRDYLRKVPQKIGLIQRLTSLHDHVIQLLDIGTLYRELEETV